MNKYPFITKNTIKSLLAADDGAVIAALLILQERQTEHEKATRTTKDRNRRGWMSSHAVTAGKLADKVAASETLTAEEIATARGMVSRYSTQLASHFRALAIEADPTLAEQGAVFGV